MKLPRWIFNGCALWVSLLVIGSAGFRASGQAELRMQGLTPVGEGVRLDWEGGSAGSNYVVQSRDVLGANGLWLPPGPESGQPWPTTLHTWIDRRTPAAASRYYRVLAVTAAQRGRVVSVSAPTTYSRANIGLIFNFAGIPVVPQYDVRAYVVIYETLDPLGGRTVASGTVVLPVGIATPLPLVSYQHGTVAKTNDVPGQEIYVGVAFATTGYAAGVPDYLGLGKASAGRQAYHHARSEGTACVDFLRAARTVCASNGRALNGQIFLAGYSQGGHATMATLRELEAFHTNEFNVAACAPMAGAYDLSGVTAEDILSGREQPNPYYFALLLAAYQSVYQLAPALGDMLAAPYDSTLPPLLRGNATGTQINDAIPAAPLQILKPAYLAAFLASEEHPFRLALRENDLYRWKPRAPLRLFHCAGDQDVPPANSQVAYEHFQAAGATQVQLVDPLPTADHSGCVFPSLLEAKAWFDTLRN